MADSSCSALRAASLPSHLRGLQLNRLPGMQEGRLARCWQTAGPNICIAETRLQSDLSVYDLDESLTLEDLVDESWSSGENRRGLFASEVDGMSGRDASSRPSDQRALLSPVHNSRAGSTRDQ